MTELISHRPNPPDLIYFSFELTWSPRERTLATSLATSQFPLASVLQTVTGMAVNTDNSFRVEALEALLFQGEEFRGLSVFCVFI